jgi:hypothetical protein
MGIEDLQNPPGVINRAPLHRHEPGITQMTQHLGDRLDLPSAIAAKYQRSIQTSALQTFGHRLQRKEAIGPADSELIRGFGHLAPPEAPIQTPQIPRQAEVTVPSPMQETITQTFRIRRSPQSVTAGPAIMTAMAGGPLNPPNLGDFESISTARSPKTIALRGIQERGLGGDPIAQSQAATIVQRKVASEVQTKVPYPVQETTTQTFRIRRSPQGVTGGQAIASAMAGPLNPPSLGDFEPGSMARSPQDWGLGGDSIAQSQAETIVHRKVASEVQTAVPTKAEMTIYRQTSIQRSPTPPLQLHRQPQTDEIKRYAIDSSEVLQQPTTTPHSETGALQRSVESSPLLLHSQAIVQRVPNDGYTTIPTDQRIAPSRSEDSAQSPDITGLVDHVSRIMARQLTVERERRGL